MAEEMAMMQAIHMIIEEMPTDVLRKMFSIKVIDPDNTDLQLKSMNPKYPKHLKSIFDELKNKEEIEISVSLKLK